ncbi:hypothetical protein QOT17_000285 [Balamuthia mandrillaris]
MPRISEIELRKRKLQKQQTKRGGATKNNKDKGTEKKKKKKEGKDEHQLDFLSLETRIEQTNATTLKPKQTALTKSNVQRRKAKAKARAWKTGDGKLNVAVLSSFEDDGKHRRVEQSAKDWERETLFGQRVRRTSVHHRLSQKQKGPALHFVTSD